MVKLLGFFFFLAFSVTYNVRFTKIICMSLPHRLSIFLAFFLEFNFLALKKILNIKLTAIFLDQFVLNILYYSLYDLQI